MCGTSALKRTSADTPGCQDTPQISVDRWLEVVHSCQATSGGAGGEAVKSRFRGRFGSL
jgi:hypothetical protein